MNNVKQARVFTASLKPAWTEDQIKAFLSQNRANFECWIINHDKDLNDNGELKEPHTHILIRYENPRKIETVAKLLNVEPNFIEIVNSFKSMLRYLTHLDNPEKSLYAPFEVSTNSQYDYALLSHHDLSNKQIIEYIQTGHDMELLDMGVSISKITTAQRFVQNQNQLKGINHLTSKIEELTEKADKQTLMLEQFSKSFMNVANQMASINQQCYEILIPIVKQLVNFTNTLNPSEILKIIDQKPE